MRDDSIPVLFHGQKLVWLKHDDGTGALAYPQHLDDNGDVTAEHVFSESFGHVRDGGKVWRYGQVIGTVDDFEFVPVGDVLQAVRHRELRELLNMHLKAALGSVMDADVRTLGEKLNRCKELVLELALQDLEQATMKDDRGD